MIDYLSSINFIGKKCQTLFRSIYWIIVQFSHKSQEQPIDTCPLLVKVLKLQLSVIIYRGSRLEVFCKKGVLRNFAKFIVKHLCQSLVFNKVIGLCNYSKKETLAQVFSCEVCKQNTASGSFCIYNNVSA